VDFAAARRACGWSNATWVAGGLVVRVAIVSGSVGLLRRGAASVAVASRGRLSRGAARRADQTRPLPAAGRRWGRLPMGLPL